MEQARGLTIGALAAAAGVGVETVRYYQRRGLLSEPRPARGIRRYGDVHLARLRFVKAAQRLGFSLAEVGQLLRLDDGAHCGEARAVAQEHLRSVRERLRDLRRMEAMLAHLVAQCDTARGEISCPVIQALQEARV